MEYQITVNRKYGDVAELLWWCLEEFGTKDWKTLHVPPEAPSVLTLKDMNAERVKNTMDLEEQYQRHPDAPITCCLVFNNPDHAMYFRLRWS